MRSRIAAGALVAVAAAAVTFIPVAAEAAVDPCGAASNPIVCENSKQGTPVGDWYSPNAWGTIEGFTTKASVAPGETLRIKVKSQTPYNVTIYRLGYYNGDGARKMPTSPTQTFPADGQTTCMHDGGTGLVDCGNWTVTVNWTVPTDAVSGLYIATLDQAEGGPAGQMPYPFVVRDDSNHSDILVQTSDQTWQAYNAYGGQSLYGGGGPAPDGRAYKVSYNRPLDVGGSNGIYASEYAMIQWLERNGYDVSYASGVDVAASQILLTHKVFMSSGHDEYWTQGQWDHVMAARAAGVNLAFFSGNEVFWRTRLEPSLDTSNAANRTLVTYKMTKMAMYPVNGIADPSGQWTGTWQDPAGADTGGNTPQNQLTGTLFTVNGYRSDALTVPYEFSDLRLWRNTAVANLNPGQTATFQTGTLGYEWDSDVNNTVRPAGAVNFSSTTVSITDNTLLLDQGNEYGNGVATHKLVAYRDQTSHALVFGAGTVQWSWGLSSFHYNEPTTEDRSIQQATVNLLADMSAQPKTLQSNLSLATKSTDTTGPVVTIDAPAAGANLTVLTPVTVTGTAVDASGKVARVEVSVDGGATWRPVPGPVNTLGSWSYTWSPGQQGSATIQARAVDDSVNIGAVATRSVNVGPQTCPCTVFAPTNTPTTVDSSDPNQVELGTKFRSATAGWVSGVKFYKAAANTGTHLGRLWSSSGQLLASGTFTGESASGWQTMHFSNPVPITANTTYVVSYYAPNGHYSVDSGYFASQGAGQPALRELQSGVDGANGLYGYGTGGGFPINSFNAANYWVDVILETTSGSTQPPTVTSTSPASSATGVGLGSPVKATFSAGILTSSLQFSLGQVGGGNVAGTVSYDPGTNTATFQPDAALSPSTTYRATVTATDVWGNAMTEQKVWPFTTNDGSQLTCPCSLWSSAATPANPSSGDSNSVELGVRFSSAMAGKVTGVRFYKGQFNTGTHTGTLWSNTGQQLASGTFINETATGWQTLTFATPVTITAGTSYVVSYHAPSGGYAYNAGYFSESHSAYPLISPNDGANGLYLYGSSGFPTETYNANNYWVDVVFTLS